MYLIAIAWMYVVLMMAIAEGMAPNGGWLGAFFTLTLYGVLPLAIVLYLLGTPMRRQRKAQQSRMTENLQSQEASHSPDTKLDPPRDNAADAAASGKTLPKSPAE